MEENINLIFVGWVDVCYPTLSQIIKVVFGLRCRLTQPTIFYSTFTQKSAVLICPLRLNCIHILYVPGLGNFV